MKVCAKCGAQVMQAVEAECLRCGGPLVDPAGIVTTGGRSCMKVADLPEHILRLNPHLRPAGQERAVAAKQADPGPSAPHPDRSPGPRYRSKTEAQYAAVLAARQAAGDILWWHHEPVTLTVVPPGPNHRGVRYTPDFDLWCGAGYTLVEVKGYMHDDARKTLAAAAEFCRVRGWRLVVVRKERGGAWKEEAWT